MSVETKRDLALVRKLRERVRYQNAGFDSPSGDPDSPLPRTEREVTEFIRARTKLYVESWILPLLDELEGTGRCYEEVFGTRSRSR